MGLFISNMNFIKRFSTSSRYWENRYAINGNSGIGSYGALADYKASVINKFVMEGKFEKIIDFGCGDGNQLQYFAFPRYIGLDVSATALEKCRLQFKNDCSKEFFQYNPNVGPGEQVKNFGADLAISLDVIYHLVEDDIFETYMRHLFSASSKCVIIYAWNVVGIRKRHVKHRMFTDWVEKNEKSWLLKQAIENKELEGASDFFIFEKTVN